MDDLDRSFKHKNDKIVVLSGKRTKLSPWDIELNKKQETPWFGDLAKIKPTLILPLTQKYLPQSVILLVRAPMPKGYLDQDNNPEGWSLGSDIKPYQPESQGIMFWGLNHLWAQCSYCLIPQF